MCFVWISEQTAIISLYGINWLVFTTESECVYCAVRTECLNVLQVTLIHTALYAFHANPTIIFKISAQLQLSQRYQNLIIVIKPK
jgi:hypothetical protein